MGGCRLGDAKHLAEAGDRREGFVKVASGTCAPPQTANSTYMPYELKNGSEPARFRAQGSLEPDRSRATNGNMKYLNEE